MGHIKNSKIPIEIIGEGLTRQIMGYDSDIMLVKVNFEEGAIGYKHKHAHQQVSYVVSGKFEVEINGKKEVLVAGDSFVTSSNLVHGVHCMAKGILIDAFSPKRDDFLASNKK